MRVATDPMGSEVSGGVDAPPTSGPAEERISRNIGQAVRRLRAARGWSVRDLAGRSGISKARIAEVEKGAANPSIHTLVRLAYSFDTTLSDLLRAGEPFVSVVRAGPAGADDRPALITDTVRRRLDVHHLVMEPDQALSWDSHPGASQMEHLLLYSGSMTAGPVGYEVDLEAGDALTFQADRPHVYRASHRGARLYCLVGRTV